MSGWGIAETAPVIEKIKAESADYLRGLNSCGDITWSVYDKAFDFYMELISRAYEQGKKDAQPQWIPCSETADIPDHEVLCCDMRGEMIVGYLDRNDESNTGWWAESDGVCLMDVVAWMPLPEPRKDGESDR